MKTVIKHLWANHSYFGSGDLFAPWHWLERWLNPCLSFARCQYRGKTLNIRCTRRAQRQLRQRVTPLRVEMQLYFSCMVKKRVLFHDAETLPDVATYPVTDNLFITVRCVQSDQCDPVEFARHYPGKKQLDAPGAKKMRPRELNIDFRQGQWQGDFAI